MRQRIAARMGMAAVGMDIRKEAIEECILAAADLELRGVCFLAADMRFVAAGLESNAAALPCKEFGGLFTSIPFWCGCRLFD